MSLKTLLNQEFGAIQNRSHVLTMVILLLMSGILVIIQPKLKEYTVIRKVNSLNLGFKMGITHIPKVSKTEIKSELITKPNLPIVKQSVIAKESKKSVFKKEIIKNSVKNVDVKERQTIEGLNEIFDKVEAKSKPSNTVPMYDQIDYSKNAKELGIFLENENVALPKLEGDSITELSKNIETVIKNEEQLMSDKQLEAIANMLYNNLTQEDKSDVLPEVPADWFRKWEGVESKGLMTVVGLLVNSDGKVIKTVLIKSSGLPKADTIITYGLVGEKYDMSKTLIKGQYKWLELAISFQEDTF